MVKSMYAYVREAWKRPDKSDVEALLWDRMQIWRREGSVVRVEHPTRIDRARSLGFRAKQGIAVARVKVRRGGRRRSRYVRARRSARMGKNRNSDQIHLASAQASLSIAHHLSQRPYPPPHHHGR